MQQTTLKDELERKTLETFEWLIERSSMGEFGDPEIRVALQAIFNVTCGLVAPDITMASEAVEIDKLEQLVHRRVFTRTTGAVAIVSWKTGSSVVTLTTMNRAGEVVPRQFESPDSRVAKATFVLTCNKLGTEGFREVT